MPEQMPRICYHVNGPGKLTQDRIHDFIRSGRFALEWQEPPVKRI
jgi:hypothetical protein